MARPRKNAPPAQEKVTDRKVSRDSSNDGNNGASSKKEKHSIASEATAQSAQSILPKDTTRHKLAIVYVGAFLLIVALTIGFMLCECYSVTDIKDILLAESGILSGPLGFIIGFYFKEEISKTNNI